MIGCRPMFLQTCPFMPDFRKGYRIDWSRSSRPELTAALRSLSWKKEDQSCSVTCLQIHTLNLVSHSRQRWVKNKKEKKGAFSTIVREQSILIYENSYKMNGVGGKLKYLIMKARRWSCRCEAERLRCCLLSLHMSYSYPVSAAIFPNSCVPNRKPCRALRANVW